MRDPYQTGCGNDSPENHKCNQKQCAKSDDSDDSDNNNGSDDDSDDSEDDDAEDCDDAGANPINPTKANHHREVSDITTFGPAPISFSRNVNSRTTDFNDTYWELGAKQVWQHNWNYETRQLSTKTYGFFDIKVRYPDGNDYNFKATDSTGAQLAPAADNGDRLYRWTGSTVGYTLLTRDGKEYDFWRYLSPKFKLTQLRNGLGFYWNCTYDSNNRLIKITNNFGRWIQIDRETGTDGLLRINRVSTSDGRMVSYNYSQWAGSANFILSSVSYPGGEQANYTYVTADPSSATARPLLSAANDPAYRHGRPGAQMKYVYNYNSFSFSGVITGTLLEERSNVTDETIVSFPLGSGTYPKVQEGNGALLTRRYTNGLLSTKGDGEGRMTTFTRDSNGYGFIAAKADANGAVTQYTRDYAGRILTKTDALGHTRSQVYNSKGFMLTKRDELNRTMTWTRDSTNRRTRKDYPDGSYETWTYNGASQVLTHRLRNGGTESFAYNSSGDMTSKADAMGNLTNFTYYQSGLVSSMIDARLTTTSYTYNWRGQILTVTHPDSSTTSYNYDTFGNRTAVTDELNHTTSYTYDEYNRIRTATDPLSRTTSYEYGLTPGCTGCSYANTVSRIISPAGRVTTYQYDNSRLRTSQTIGAGTADAATTSYAYDSAKNLTTVTDPRGKVWTFGYDNRNRVISAADPLGNTTQWSYDEHGNKLTEMRPDGGVTHYVYDNRNHLIQTIDPAGHITQMTYDNADNLLSFTDARSNAYAYTYDALNRKSSLKYPDNSTEGYTYDPTANLATYTTRAGQVRTYSYDNRNRETGSTWSDNTPAVSAAYDAAGRLLTLNSQSSALGYTYDDANQLLSETQSIAGGPGSKTVNYGYDGDGKRSSLTYPNSDVITYGYSGRDQVAVISVNGAAPLASYSYDAAANRLGKTLGNGTAAIYAYDDGNRLLSVDNKANGTSFAEFEYAYNSVNKRTSRTQFIGGTTPVSSIDIYGYDPIDQLTEVKYNFNSGANTQDRQVEYFYDPVGNRTSVSDNGSIASYSVNNLNEYTSANSGALSSDTNGNLVAAPVSGTSWAYTYDAQNRLTGASSPEAAANFSYDARNRCVSRTASGVTTYYYYDNWNLIEERDASDAQVARYVHGANTDELLARITPTMVSYYHHDALGSAIALTDATGNVMERYSYDVYGAPTFKGAAGNALTGSAYGNRFLFTGREYLPDLGLYDYRNRVYSPSLGRFLQTDSMRFDGDVNFYRYVMNSPGNLQDPFGLYSWHDFWEWLKAMAHIIVPGHESVEAARTLPAIVRIANEQKAQEEWVQCMNNPPPEDCDCSKAFDHLNEVKNQTDN